MKKKLRMVLLVGLLLCGCSRKNTDWDGKTAREYQAVFSGFSGEPEEMNVTLYTKELQRFPEGVLYELTVDSEETAFETYEQDMEERLDGGLFFVCGREIYFIRGGEARENDPSPEEMMRAGILVCSETGKEDPLGEEKGWHTYIAADGGRREYHAYNDQTETGYYECFVWEAERGLVQYWSGYGARSRDVELSLPGEERVR